MSSEMQSGKILVSAEEVNTKLENLTARYSFDRTEKKTNWAKLKEEGYSYCKLCGRRCLSDVAFKETHPQIYQTL